MKPPIRVKFLSRIRMPDNNVGVDFLRRFPGRVPEIDNCRFIFDRDCSDYDWLVVYDDMPRKHPIEHLACPRENTLLITGEPSSITHFGKSFLRQFGHVLTSQEPWALEHPHVIRRQAGLYWHYGGLDDRGTHDSLVRTPPIEKTKLISSVCSTKAMRHTMHFQRLAFTRRLMGDLPEMEVFGYGMARLDNKADAIDPYRYHLAIENHSCPHHWTEKLADAYLGYALPIYFGCTNLDDYFPADSYVWIDIRNYSESLERIRSVISADDYEARLPAIIEARRRVLEDYATFPQVAGLIGARNAENAARQPDAAVFSRRLSRKRNPLDWPLEIMAKIKQKLRMRGHR